MSCVLVLSEMRRVKKNCPYITETATATVNRVAPKQTAKHGLSYKMAKASMEYVCYTPHILNLGVILEVMSFTLRRIYRRNQLRPESG
jgi:hypothetical protein